ncbi:MAG: sirohydrochlorin chelatase [Planctomycetales bacterium]|nr:sirohydrochlorin chelatase [Planctomycetales bacterium]MBN8624592.1 sirohydrochlorin chelatase [Planctomycetota bacterium]
MTNEPSSDSATTPSDDLDLTLGDIPQREPFDAAQAAASGAGVLLVGHGTGDAAGLAEALTTTKLLAERLAPLPVEPCFLELAEPSIDAAVVKLAARGVRRLLSVPVILFAAGHAKRDIPAAVGEACDRHGLTLLGQTPHLGCRPEMLALSQRRFDEACADQHHEPTDTMLVMVGRGSTHADANEEMHVFAKLRASSNRRVLTTVAFAAMAQPALEPILETAAQFGRRLIVVQPHLLFTGVLLERVASITAAAAKRHKSARWTVARHLGAEPELVDCLARLVSEADFR